MQQTPTPQDSDRETSPDEQAVTFVYGNLLIKDPLTGEIVVNKRF